jgi:hypothetical protein
MLHFPAKFPLLGPWFPMAFGAAFILSSCVPSFKKQPGVLTASASLSTVLLNI